MFTTVEGMSETVGIDWQALYNDIEQRGDVLYAKSENIGATSATFQTMYLDLAEIKSKITESRFDPALVIIYADVLNIPLGTNWLLQNAALFLVARRLHNRRRRRSEPRFSLRRGGQPGCAH